MGLRPLGARARLVGAALGVLCGAAVRLLLAIGVLGDLLLPDCVRNWF